LNEVSDLLGPQTTKLGYKTRELLFRLSLRVETTSSLYNFSTNKMEVTNTFENRAKFYCLSRKRQYYSAFAVNLGTMICGTAWSWTATAIPSINSDTGPHTLAPLTSAQQSWITSMIFVRKKLQKKRNSYKEFLRFYCF